MGRTILISGLMSFVMAFLGAAAAIAVTMPGSVTAQQAGIQSQSVGVADDQGNTRAVLVVGPDGTPAVILRNAPGTDRVLVSTGPGIAAGVYLLDESGTHRVQLSTGAPAGAGGGNPDAAGLTFNGSDGSTALARLGTINTPDGTVAGMRLFLSDPQGNRRIDLSVSEDGTPGIHLLDAAGNVTWSAP